MPGIFISYRRGDTEAIVGRIADDLVERFGQQAVFRDIDSISFGVDFRKQLEDTLARCDVLLAVVGLHSLQDAAGKRLLENQKDWVRFELERAMARKIHVIPILVNGAPTVTAEVLPEALEDIAYYPQMRLDTGIDYHNHIERLIGAIVKCSPEASASPTPADIQQSDRLASSHTPHHQPHHSATRLAEATPHKRFGGAEAALAISVVGFVMLWAVFNRGFGFYPENLAIVARLELPWIAFFIMGPSIFVCNYILDGPDTWRDAFSRRPVVSLLLRALARTIEATCWLFGVWMAFLLFVASSGNYGGYLTADYFVALIAISLLTAATAIYLFRYKWRWAKALRGSPKT